MIPFISVLVPPGPPQHPRSGRSRSKPRRRCIATCCDMSFAQGQIARTRVGSAFGVADTLPLRRAPALNDRKFVESQTKLSNWVLAQRKHRRTPHRASTTLARRRTDWSILGFTSLLPIIQPYRAVGVLRPGKNQNHGNVRCISAEMTLCAMSMVGARFAFAAARSPCL